MNKLLLSLSVLFLGISSLPAQDEIFDSGLPKSKQAMLVVDVSLASIFETPTIGPMLNPMQLVGFGPPIEFEDYRQMEKVTVFVGAPNMRTDTADFVTRIKVKDKEFLPKLVKALFGWGGAEMRTRKEDGWNVVEHRERWPEVIRYRDNTLEFGTSLYTFSPSRGLVSKSMATAFGELDKGSQVRVAFDSQVLSKLMDAFLQAESAREDAVYQMIKWGEFINESSILLYGVNILKELDTASLSVNIKADTMAKLTLKPMSGKEESVKAKALVLHDFMMFHVKLPIATLKEKKNPVAGILEKFADGIQLSTTGPEYELTLSKPKDLSKDFLAVVEKMKVSFADRDNSNRMKMLALTAHNYHDTYRRMPFYKNPNEGDRFSDDLSWRVRVLPFCELQREFESMDISKAWDAKANQAVVAKGNDTFVLSNGALVCSIKTEPKATAFRNILDGTSNTIMLIENRNAAMTPWTKPLDLTIDEAVKSVMGLKKGDFLWVAMFDGSVHRLRGPKDNEITERELRNMFDPRDGNPVSMDRFLEDPQPRLFDGIDRPRRARDYRYAKKDVKEAFGEAEAFDTPAPARPRAEKKRDFDKFEDKKADRKRD